MHFILKIWFTQNEFLVFLYESLIQSTKPREISDSISVWMMRYSNFCVDIFCCFFNFLPFYYYETSDLRQKSQLYSKKPNDAVEVFAIIGSKHHWEGPRGNISLITVDL